MLNNFRAGYTREPQMWVARHIDQGLLQKIGLTGVNPPGDILPRVQFGDTYQNWSDETKNKGMQVNNTLQFADTLAVFRGNHNLKFGADMRWQQTNGADSAGQQGLFAFNRTRRRCPRCGPRQQRQRVREFPAGRGGQRQLQRPVCGAGNPLSVQGAVRAGRLEDQPQADVESRACAGTSSRRARNTTPIFPASTRACRIPARAICRARFASSAMVRAATTAATSFADTYYKAFGPRVGFAYQLFAEDGAARRLWNFVRPGQRQRRSARFAEVHLRLQCGAELRHAPMRA